MRVVLEIGDELSLHRARPLQPSSVKLDGTARVHAGPHADSTAICKT